MRDTEVNSSQRTIPQIDGNNSENERANSSRFTKEQKINIILILIGIIGILIICVYVVYYIFALKDSKSPIYLSNDKIDSNLDSTKIDSRCEKFLDNCQQCNIVDSSFTCTSCKDGYYPEYDENNIMIYCLKKCQIGDSQYCKSCNSNYPNQCDSCNSGYLLPLDDIEKTQCTKCPDNCSHCTGKKSSIICDTCEEHYILSLSTNQCFESCTIGQNSLCQTCDEDSPNNCGTCNIGYFLPSDSKTECKKCSDLVPNCIRGFGTSSLITCTSCSTNYFLTLGGECSLGECKPGLYYGCKECEDNKCSSCNEGYYLPTDDNIKSQCSKCSDVVNNCIECSGQTNNIICTKCENNYLLSENKCIKCKTGIYDSCKTCDSDNPNFCGSCNNGYYLALNEPNKEKCKKCSDAINNCEECNYDDENNKVICTSCNLNYYLNDSNECVIACTIKSGIYCKTCNTQYLNQCQTCNYGYYLPSDDPTKSICKKCTDLSSNCNECSGTLTSVICKSCTNNYYVYSGVCYKKCEIGENKYCKSCNPTNQTQCETCNDGYYLPDDDPDKTKCKACNIIKSNCNECSGTLNSVTCTKCDNDLILYNNKCYPKCQIGNDEYCKSCNPELQHQCGTCNDGFYLPKDDIEKTRCQNCNRAIDYCNKCYSTDTDVICTGCSNNYYVYENKCIKGCETGTYFRCKTCNPENPKQCGSCNDGYYLPTDDEFKTTCINCRNYIQFCKKCYGNRTKPTCTECDSKYFLNTNKNRCEDKCTLGEAYRCRDCDIITNECKVCNYGYYLPSDANYKYKCKSCSDTDIKCKECSGSDKQIICTSCNNGYYPGYNDKNEVVSCNYKCLGNKYYCTTCDEVTNNCIECPEGYYMPIDALSKVKCVSCFDLFQNCKVCQGTTTEVECSECKNNYYFSEDKTSCNPKCQIGNNARCKECDYEKNQCESCNSGYYLPNDDNLKLSCKKCSDIDANCEECEGSKVSIKCTKCKTGYKIPDDSETENKICEIDNS